MQDHFNLEAPVEIGPGTYWIGAATKELLQRNIYLRVFSGNEKTVNLLIDPGPPVDFETMSRKVAEVAGNLSNVHFAYVNHQDPDVIGSAPQLLQLNPGMLFLLTDDTRRLVQYYGIPHANFRSIELFSGLKTILVTGHTLRFVPTPFCHFRGACMLYDPETRILFSGDLFGGIAARMLVATETAWAGIRAFHELYMPSNEALRLAVKRIRELSPPPLMIAPQHGSILSGPLVEKFLGKMDDLRVGLDILNSLDQKIPQLIAAINGSLAAAREMIGEAAVRRVMQVFQPDGSYPAIFSLGENGKVTDIKAEPFAAVKSLAKLLFRECSAEEKHALQLKMLVLFVERNLPPLESAIDWEVPEKR